MTTPVFTRVILNPENGLFEMQIGPTKITMAPDEFLKYAQYIGKVGASYVEWLKNGGK